MAGLTPPPQAAEALDRATAALNRGDRTQAQRLSAEAYRLGRGHPEILLRHAGILGACGAIDDSRRVYEELLAIAPGHGGALAGLGALLAAEGRHDEAVAHLEQSRAQQPGSLEIAFQLANALRQAGRLEEAAEEYQAMLARAPQLVPVQINLGALLLTLGRAGEALAVLRQAARAAPSHPFVWSNLAAAHLLVGDLEPAVSAARRAVELAPENPQARVTLGNALSALKRPAEARACFDAALERDPENREALIALANVADAADDFETAVDFFQRALTLSPQDPCTLGSLYMLLRRTCRWAEAEEAGARLDRLPFATSNTPAEPVMTSVTRSPDTARNFAVARAWGRSIEEKMGRNRSSPPAGPRERLTIGYLSYDLRDHAIGQLVRSLFSQHARDGFRILGFSYGPNDGSPYRRHFEQSFDRFIDLAPISHEAAAAAIRDEGVDILVDLTGHTKGNRLEICALRPAPLQVTWLGFPGTTGAAFIDYILTDRVLTRQDEERCYSEAPVFLPHSYQANDRWQEIAADAGLRNDHGLPEGAFVFAALVNSYKIDAPVFDCWMRILQAVPGSVLWLLCRLETVMARLRAEAAERGIDPERLIFAPFLAKADHLARLAHADLALDTRVYTGHTTTSDCLFAGLPVVTAEGHHFASRVSESLLCAVGLPHLVAPDLAAYETLALDLARDTDALATERRTLEEKRLRTPLFDTGQTARDLERAYRAMWARAEQGLPPAPIDVAALPE